MSNNVLEFFVKMKDMMSGGLSKLASNAHSSFSKIQDDIDKTTAKNNKLSDSFKGVDAGAARGGAGIGSFIGKLGLIGAAIGVVTVALSAAFALGNKSIEKAMQYGSIVKSFEVLTGSAQSGQQLAGALSQVSQDTILGDGIFKNAQTMMGFGINQNEVISNIKMLGDVSMGSQEKLDALTLAYSQVQAAGKLTGQDLLQFINAGFNPLNEIAKKTGLSIGVLKEKMEKGAISAQMITEAFKSATGAGGLYNGMLEKIAETPAGKLAKLQGQWEAFQVKLGMALMPLAEMAMDFVEPLITLAEKVLPVISTIVNAIVAPIRFLADETAKWAEKSELVRDVLKAIEISFKLFDVFLKGMSVTFEAFYNTIIKPIIEAIDNAYVIAKYLFGFKVGKGEKVSSNQQPLETYVPGLNNSYLNNPFLNRSNPFGPKAPGKTDPTSIYSSLFKGDKKDGKEGKVSSGITGGGPRVVTINGVKFMEKLADKLEINNQGDMDKIQQVFQEMFLRILNSGASLQ